MVPPISSSSIASKRQNPRPCSSVASFAWPGSNQRWRIWQFPENRWKFSPFFDMKQMPLRSSTFASCWEDANLSVGYIPNFYWYIPLGCGDTPCSRRSHPNLPVKVHALVESFLVKCIFCYVYMVSAKFLCHPCDSIGACSNSLRDSTPSWFASIASKSCCICRGSHQLGTFRRSQG